MMKLQPEEQSFLTGCGQEEKEIAIVTHNTFLYRTLSYFGHDCHPSIQEEMCKQFAKCEIRSIILVDRSMIGAAACLPQVQTTNYPGKIPSGLDKPSDHSQSQYSDKNSV